VAEKPHDAAVKFDIIISKFTVASHGPPCDSTALVTTALSLTVKPANRPFGVVRGL